ncbi:uncharacterized protein MEPE_02234 [Melanopsichium pennsylvanicum]|uniref:Cytoplasmic tRNA 2-thiolation protein 2 n=2 Tax=Melanopsichium pennsylvanicum TaxID=63383 RepID=A0AAJ4XJJ0_9BASI|nr:hypothetical protein BN887_05019 [Melanopsichium pennsylvanicum 4]SNX83527.1 uncharacterized protein MEPE_02234 [Melanopsichium pennsylvanicum]
MPCPQPEAIVRPPTTIITCIRCKSAPAIAIFRDSIYCQNCALSVFDQKAKSGLEFARGAGLAHYVAASRSTSTSLAPGSVSSASASRSAPFTAPSRAANVENGDNSESVIRRKKLVKEINNGSGNATANVSANIAIAFSGGASSRALLRTAVQYFRPEKRFANREDRKARARGEALPQTEENSNGNFNNASGRFNGVGKIYVIHVDDSTVIPDGVDMSQEIRAMVEAEGCADLEFVPVKLEDVYRSTSSEHSFEGVPWKLHDVDSQLLSSNATTISNPTQALKDLFSFIHPTITPRTAASSARTRVEDLHYILLSGLLRRVSAALNCSSLLLGESATRVSIRLIESLAKGAGHKLAVQNSDAVWIDDLLVVRPLKAHLLQEVLFYTNALGLDSVQPEQHIVTPTVLTSDILTNKTSNVPAMDKSSIARLTETFILNLEQGVPSTVTTIGRTGHKLVLNTPPLSDTYTTGSSSSTVADVSTSTTKFQQVGPSISLKSRAGLTGKMAELKVVEEPRIGSRGAKLAQASEACFHWNSALGCALCGMPSQHPHARYWKKDITISSLNETAPSTQKQATDILSEEERGRNWIELSDHLCYACLLVLAPPLSASEEADVSLLPSHVLDHIQRDGKAKDSLGKEEANGLTFGRPRNAAEDESEVQEEKKQSHCGNHKNDSLQPLKRAQIKAKIDEFLLED